MFDVEFEEWLASRKRASEVVVDPQDWSADVEAERAAKAKKARWLREHRLSSRFNADSYCPDGLSLYAMGVYTAPAELSWGSPRTLGNRDRAASSFVASLAKGDLSAAFPLVERPSAAIAGAARSAYAAFVGESGYAAVDVREALQLVLGAGYMPSEAVMQVALDLLPVARLAVEVGFAAELPSAYNACYRLYQLASQFLKGHFCATAPCPFARLDAVTTIVLRNRGVCGSDPLSDWTVPLEESVDARAVREGVIDARDARLGGLPAMWSEFLSDVLATRREIAGQLPPEGEAFRVVAGVGVGGVGRPSEIWMRSSVDVSMNAEEALR